MGTSTIFEKGGGLIAVTGITQTIDVNVNIVACWTITVVMHIIVIMIECALVVDCCRMRMNKTMIAIGCMIPVTAMSHPPFSKIVLVPMEIQRSSSMD